MSTLNRRTDKQEKLNGLDHLRTMAILFVFLFHYFILSGGEPGWLPGVAKFGWTGVDLFFVLSGFLISSQLFFQIKNNKGLSLKTFFLKRFFRIIPAYWVTVAIYFCIPFFREKESLPPLWKFLSFTQNLGLNLKDQGTFSHAWSLCVEEHFYFFLPMILVLVISLKLFKKAYWLLIAFFIAGFVLRIFSYDHLYLPKQEAAHAFMHWYKYIYYPTYNRLDGLLTGICIAAVYVFRPVLWNKLTRYGNQLIMLSLLVLTGAYFLCIEQESRAASVFGFTLVSLGYGFLVMAAISPTSLLYQWNSRVTSSVAMLSYSIYLTHKGVIHITHQLLAPLHAGSNLMLFVSIITSIAAAFMMNKVIEKPFLKWRQQILSRASAK